MSHYRMLSRVRAAAPMPGAPLDRLARLSPAHLKAWRTRRAKNSQAIAAHLAALRADIQRQTGETK